MRYILFNSNEVVSFKERKKLPDIKNCENYFDLQQSIFFQEITLNFYSEELISKIENNYEYLVSLARNKDELERNIKKDKNKIFFDDALVSFLRKDMRYFYQSQIIFLLDIEKISVQERLDKFINIILDHFDKTIENNLEINFCIHPDVVIGGNIEKLDSDYFYFIKYFEDFYIKQSLEREQGGLNKLDDLFFKSGSTLLEGETGVGKTKIAELVSNTVKRKMVYKNISAVSEELLSSTLRGYVKGSFTGAVKDMPGIFEDANENILFLDEFQNFSMNAQVQLLDLLSPTSNYISISRIGSNEVKEINVKVIIAINEDVDELLKNNRLRKDIFHRIRNICKIKSLNDRFKTFKENHYNVEAYIIKLFYIIFWKSFCVDGYLIKLNDNSLSPKLFPYFNNSMVNMVVSRKWTGNYRELNVKLLDIFYLYHHAGFNLDSCFEKNLIDQGIDNTIIDKEKNEKVAEVENAMIRNNYNFSKTGKELEKYKLKSYQSLVRFIKQHQDEFSESFLMKIEKTLGKS